MNVSEHINAPLKVLLDTIGSKEAPQGYGQIFSGAKSKLPKGTPTNVAVMSLNSVLALQNLMRKYGSASTACGRYQFLQKTLMATIRAMDLDGTEIWTPTLQDHMAVTLMEGRGLNKYLRGELSAENFANNLAMEWASLPVVTPINGKYPGQSYYHGDGLNKALHDPAIILAMVKALRVPPPAPPVVPEPQSAHGLLTAIIGFILSLFKKGN